MQKMKKKPKVVDLFAGIGGISIGFKKAGYQILVGVEIDPEIAHAFRTNLHVECLPVDIQEIDGKSLLIKAHIKKGELDVLVGGPPCQGFSMANRKRILDDPRNRLFVHFIKIVGDVLPKVVLIENVPGLKSDPVCSEIIGEFMKIGYTLNVEVLNAADFGVPQLRERMFFIGARNSKKFVLPAGHFLPKRRITHINQQEFSFGNKGIKNKLPYVTVWEAISDLPSLERGQESKNYTKKPETEYQKKCRGRQKVLHNHKATPHSEEAYKRIRLIKQGQNWRDLPANLQTGSVHSGAYGRLIANEPATTITTRIDTPTTGRVIHPYDHRTITIREGARLQSFDDSIKFTGTRTSMGKQLGNAVPPLLAENLAKEIKKQFLENY